MIRPAHIYLAALLAAGAIFIPAAHAGFFSGWQDIYVSADDGKAYDFYANGEFLCSGKRCHCTNTSATVKIDSRAHMHRYQPSIVNHTNWARPAQNKDFLVPKKTPHFSDWQKSPYGE